MTRKMTRIALGEREKQFLRSTVSLRWSPEGPLLRAAWAGAAFDRNVDGWAPVWFWDAFLRAAGEVDSRVMVAEASCLFEEGDLFADRLQLAWESIKDYLLDDFRFVVDRVLWSTSHQWIIVMDQDVTRFTGEKKRVAPACLR